MNESIFRWGRITGVSPLRVKLDGDAEPLPTTPDSLVDPQDLAVGVRVRCELSAHRIIIQGRKGDATVMVRNRQAGAVTVGAATTVTAYSYTPPAASRTRLAIINGTWHIGSNLTSSYAEISIRVDGADIATARCPTGSQGTLVVAATALIPAGETPVIQLRVVNQSGTTISATADTRFWHLVTALV